MNGSILPLSKYEDIQRLGFGYRKEEVLPSLQELQKTSGKEGDELIRVR